MNSTFLVSSLPSALTVAPRLTQTNTADIAHTNSMKLRRASLDAERQRAAIICEGIAVAMAPLAR
ncbi:MAG: hypothetical protein ABI318_13300 [Chthoniobacteraceae bacterium]